MRLSSALREVRMSTVIIAAAIVGFLLLVGTTVILVVLNWSERTLAPVLSILVVGTATMLAAVLVGLKPSTIESAFTTSVVIDTVSGTPPFLTVDPNKPEVMDRFSDFLRMGQPAINQDGNTVITIQRPKNDGERFTFCGELIQYYLVRTIQRLQKGGWKAGMVNGVSTAKVTTPMRLSKIQDYPGEIFLSIVATNRFSNSDMEHLEWKHVHFFLPKDTQLKLIHTASSLSDGVEKFIVRLEKPRFFVIDFVVEPLLGTGSGILPKGVSAASGTVTENNQTYQYKVTMLAKFEWITAGNQQTQEYKDWANWLFSGLQERIGD
jgi:hypothetical protein